MSIMKTKDIYSNSFRGGSGKSFCCCPSGGVVKRTTKSHSCSCTSKAGCSNSLRQKAKKPKLGPSQCIKADPTVKLRPRGYERSR